jgi:hypothetical protein
VKSVVPRASWSSIKSLPECSRRRLRAWNQESVGSSKRKLGGKYQELAGLLEGKRKERSIRGVLELRT